MNELKPRDTPWDVVGLSGGKDSTALAFALKDKEPRDYKYICTPTGDESPQMIDWWVRLGHLLGSPLIPIHNEKAPTLDKLIEIMGSLPNNRQRWCTRILKIEPTIAWCIKNAPVTMYVGLRADEEEREGIYGPYVKSDYPFRRWGWGEDDVWCYLGKLGLIDDIPVRTDCLKCYDQKIAEWYLFWRDQPERYEAACKDEDRTGYTYRSPTRDTWPASLREMAEEFKKGRKIRGGIDLRSKVRCRVCSL